ncbi:MAG: family 78 glycoside hydrolase catalytic domain, partial [Firmicutes bacterium]|nr:family 78 glycoside hydrolase catalytic domain [Bacillota bacterium]
PVLSREIQAEKPVQAARLYICGLGLYEASLNGEKIGDEYLSPGLCAYDKWLPYQTYDVTGMLKGSATHLSVALGNGWYKGRYGLDRKHNFHYGEAFALIAEIHITYIDGSTAVVVTDKHWNAKRAKVLASGIFDGEYTDTTLVADTAYPVKPTAIDKALLKARISPPTREMLTLRPVEIIRTPAGETVLDMGQNMVGFFSFYCDVPAGTELYLQFGEVLQGGNFYRDNLRTAKAEFKYVSDGRPVWVRQYFTFFGFRFVKLTQWAGDVRAENFKGIVLYSDMAQTGAIETGNPKVNRLFENTLWGQRGNYLDVPTDCPQRDERMGWTGDAQVFFGTAAFNMDVASFFEKFLYDMGREQAALDGWIPVVVPKHDVRQVGACAWGDAATIIPWNLYVRYGDLALLKAHYPLMKGWVDAICAHDDKTGGTRMWKGSFHYGDWLSLDVEDPVGYRFGGTERTLLATCYYYYSATLLVKAAKVLGKQEDALAYQKLADAVRAAFLREYLTPGGRLAVTTQTAYVLTLFIGILPEEARAQAAYALRMKLKESDYHLRTGFIGTPYLCRVLSATGSNDIAYKLLLQEDFPSWLYEVNMGATTIWERWNSILPDGSISDTGMNSLNHYSYGSIVEWMYRDVCGIQPVEEAPGFQRFRLEPKPDRSLGFARARFDSPSGSIESEWRYEGNTLHYRFTVPFGATATLTLPGEAQVTLLAGEYQFTRETREDALGLDTPIRLILDNETANAVLKETLPELPAMMLFDMMAGERSLQDMINEGFLKQDDPKLMELLERWKTI